jgi:hypothetical protein
LFKLRPGHVQREDNHKHAKMGFGRVKIFFSRTIESEDLIFTGLIIYGFTSRSRIFHLYGDVTTAGEGCKF